MKEGLLCASGGCTQNAKKRAFWRCTVSAASAQTYFGGFETFTVEQFGMGK
jgi:hypothetical protein